METKYTVISEKRRFWSNTALPHSDVMPYFCKKPTAIRNGLCGFHRQISKQLKILVRILAINHQRYMLLQRKHQAVSHIV